MTSKVMEYDTTLTSLIIEHAKGKDEKKINENDTTEDDISENMLWKVIEYDNKHDGSGI